MTELPPAIPAASLVILRDRPGRPPELLMLERAPTLAFAGGALVFPGGRVDPGDHAAAGKLGGDGEEIAARLAAIRETIEEAGVAIGLPDAVADARAMLATVGIAGLAPDLDALVPFARWCPAHALPRRFDARFFLAHAPAGAEGVVDGTEHRRLVWATAQAHLAAADQGAATLVFPTRRLLERLETFADFAEAAADARARPERTVVPWEELRDGVPHLCIPEGLGYPVTAEPLARAQRQ